MQHIFMVWSLEKNSKICSLLESEIRSPKGKLEIHRTFFVMDDIAKYYFLPEGIKYKSGETRLRIRNCQRCRKFFYIFNI